VRLQLIRLSLEALQFEPTIDLSDDLFLAKIQNPREMNSMAPTLPQPRWSGARLRRIRP